MLFWGHTAEKPPTDKITIGHENTGTVVAMGKNVTGFKIGDKVGCLGCSSACCESSLDAAPANSILTRGDNRRLRGMSGSQPVLRGGNAETARLPNSRALCPVFDH